MGWVYWAILAAVGAGRLWELIVSRRNRNRMQTEHGAHPGADPIFPLMVFLHVMPFWAIPAEWIGLERTFEPALGIPMLVVFGLATVLRLWVLLSLKGYWNAQVMVPPDLQPVTVGPYHYIRHPNYVVVSLELFSLPLIMSCYYSAVALTLLNAFVLYFRIRSEEALLLANPTYRQTMGHKKRFIPGLW